MSTNMMTRSEHGALPVAADPIEEANVSGLVRLAIEQKVPVEALERLVALQERVMERDARTAFVEALAAFRQECPPILKTRENSQFQVTRSGVKRNARYAPLEDIDRTAGPIAARHGLTWTWDTRIEGDAMIVGCRVMHVMGHAEVTTVTMPTESKAGSSPQQKYGSAQTYGMRYSLVAALGITTADEDTDGNAQREVERITEMELADLEALVDEVRASRAKLMEWAGVNDLADMPKSRLAEAIRILERKRA